MKRLKCPHCGKVADFHHDFCTLCWSHFAKGNILGEPQIEAGRVAHAKTLKQVRWQADFVRYQKLAVVPAVLLTIQSLAGFVITLLISVAVGFSWTYLGLPALALIGCGVGGYLVGGCRELPLAALLLAVGALVFGSTSMPAVFQDSAGVSVKSAVVAVLSALQLVAAVQIWRLGPKPE